MTLANVSDVSRAVALSGTSLKNSVLSIELARAKGQKPDNKFAAKSPAFNTPRGGRQQFGGRGGRPETRSFISVLR